MRMNSPATQRLPSVQVLPDPMLPPLQGRRSCSLGQNPHRGTPLRWTASHLQTMSGNKKPPRLCLSVSRQTKRPHVCGSRFRGAFFLLMNWRFSLDNIFISRKIQHWPSWICRNQMPRKLETPPWEERSCRYGKKSPKNNPRPRSFRVLNEKRDQIRGHDTNDFEKSRWKQATPNPPPPQQQQEGQKQQKDEEGEQEKSRRTRKIKKSNQNILFDEIYTQHRSSNRRRFWPCILGQNH